MSKETTIPSSAAPNDAALTTPSPKVALDGSGADSPERSVLERLTRAMHAVLCESNGVHDNIWRLHDGTELTADWPWASFHRSLDLANAAYEEALKALGPDFCVWNERVERDAE